MSGVSPLLVAIGTSIVGTTFLIWHRHGGPTWMFAAGGFLFILGRLMIAALCAFVAVYFLSATDKMDGTRLLIFGLPTAIITGIGAWSVFVIARSVWRDAFGRAQEDGARLHHGNREAQDSVS